MHLIIQIPCYNEAETLPETLASLPTQIPGVDRLDVLIIDDGSSDNTAEVAARCGVRHIVRHAHNRGLAAAFQTGIEAGLRLGADIIVNTDADGQYLGEDIPGLIEPIQQGQADIVIGDRQTHKIAHFSPLKRWLQKSGSWVVRLASNTKIPDATSGFRAFSRNAALRLNILTRYTYTLETIIQAGKKGLVIHSVPIRTNYPTRQSRLVRSNWDYVKRSAATILRIYTFYEPLRTFSYLSLPFFLIGGGLLARFFYFFFTDTFTTTGRYVQSVVVGSTLITLGLLIFVLGVVADLIAANRLLIEETLYKIKRLEMQAEPNSSQHSKAAFDAARSTPETDGST